MKDAHGTSLLVFAASLCAAFITALGIGRIRRYGDWAMRNSLYFACFAAGVLIAVSFLHIIPKSLGLDAQATVFLLTGYLFMHVLNRFVTAFVCDRPATKDYAIGLVRVLGIAIHSFVDGIIYAVTFSVSALTGTLSAIGMVLHEFPEGKFTYVLLRQGGIGDRRAALIALVAASLTTPFGVLVSFPILGRLDPATIARLLALSAGALVYVGASHLLPTAEREPQRYSLVALGAGIALVIVAAKD